MPQFENEEIAGYRIFIYGAPKEENPPHFHIVKKGQTIARFTIKGFKPLNEHSIKRNKLKTIKAYWKENKELMMEYFCAINPKLCESQD